MLAYHNNPDIKARILSQIAAHAEADEIVQGTYWENGKGCAVGCTIHSSHHAKYESLFGIPKVLAMLEDRIFEGLPNAEAKEWPHRFMSAIEPGADLSRVSWKFLYWLLTDTEVNPGIHHPTVAKAVSQCADLMFRLAKGYAVEPDEARRAEAAAKAAAKVAAKVAEAEALAARLAAGGAADAGAWAAEAAARAETVAWAEAWRLIADKLIQLLIAERAAP